MALYTLILVLQIFRLYYVDSTRIYENHNYNIFGIEKPITRIRYDGYKNEMLKKRHDQLIEFTKEANGNNFPSVKEINPNDIVGIIPKQFLPKFNISKTPVDFVDSELAEGEIHEVQADPDHVFQVDGQIPDLKEATSLDGNFDHVFQVEGQEDSEETNLHVGDNPEIPTDGYKFHEHLPEVFNENPSEEFKFNESPSEEFKFNENPSEEFKFNENPSEEFKFNENPSEEFKLFQLPINEFKFYEPQSEEEFNFNNNPTVQRVKVHVFRGPNTKYTVVGKHHKEEKYFAPWGYFVTQPIGSGPISHHSEHGFDFDAHPKELQFKHLR